MQKIINDLKESREKTQLLLLSQELNRKSAHLEIRERELNNKASHLNDVELARSCTIEFNSQSYASFYNTKIEKDKSLLTLSIAALGFLITFINSALSSHWQTAILLSAITALLLSAYTVIKIFDKNAEYIICLTKSGTDHQSIENHLKKLDAIATRSFYAGIALSIAIALTSNTEKNKMTEQNKENRNDHSELIKRSYDGASSMKPTTPQEPSKQPSQTQEKNND